MRFFYYPPCSILYGTLEVNKLLHNIYIIVNNNCLRYIIPPQFRYEFFNPSSKGGL